MNLSNSPKTLPTKLTEPFLSVLSVKFLRGIENISAHSFPVLSFLGMFPAGKEVEGFTHAKWPIDPKRSGPCTVRWPSPGQQRDLPFQ